MEKTNYTFRDVDHAVLKIFQFLQEKRQTEEELSEEGKKVYQILEGFLSTKETASPASELLPQNPLHSNHFDYVVENGAPDPDELFHTKTTGQKRAAE